MRHPVVVLIVCLLPGLRPSAQESRPGTSLGAFEPFVTKAIEQWQVPGLGLVVVKDDRVLLCAGFGRRDVERDLPVTRDTLFAIGSATKAFTAAVLGSVVETGKLDWDQPVAQSLPGFVLHDRHATEKLTPRDLVTHRSGLPRHDFVWYGGKLSRREIFDRLRFLEPNADLRERWQYQNLMFMAAGHLAGELTGSTWEDLVANRLLTPLGMQNTVLLADLAQQKPDCASPYVERNGKLVVVPHRSIASVAPAGSIYSSAADMARWLRMWLAKGKVADQRVLGESLVAELLRPQALLPTPSSEPEILLRSYAMGWFVESYRGRLRVHHGGNIDGFSAMVSFLPNDGIGVVALANMDGSGLPEAIVRHVFDRLTGASEIDWSGKLLAQRNRAKSQAAKGKERAQGERKQGTHPAHPLGEYVAEYEHPAYGTIAITAAGDRLQASMHGIAMELEHWHFETFAGQSQEAVLADEKLLFQFETGRRGDVESLTLPLEPQVAPIRFVRKPDRGASDPAVLARCAGRYALVLDPKFTLEVVIEGETLVLHPKNQRPIVLVPYRGSEWKAKSLPGYSVRFDLGNQGAAATLDLIQPNGVFQARRTE